MTDDAETTPLSPDGDRLAKVIARAGLCSRREAEDWIRAGRVVVNGQKVISPAFNVTDRDKIKVDGAPLAARQGTRVWLYHKPAGLVVTEKDPEGRETIFEVLEAQGLPRVLSIGRLDLNTEGLLLLTNDGGLKRVLELPATGWLRRYRVRAFGSVTQAQLDVLKDGIEVEGVRYGSIEATFERQQGGNVWLIVALREGKNREVKNVLAALGLKVNRLIRISYGPFQLGDLPIGGVEPVKARVLRDQLGKRLAEEAGADFESEMPDSPAGMVASGRSHNPADRLTRIGGESFKFADRPEKTVAERRADSAAAGPRPDRPGRGPIRRPARPAPTRRDDFAQGPVRQVHFDDGREPQEFVQKARGKVRDERTAQVIDGDANMKGAGKGFGGKASFGDRPKRNSGDRAARPGGRSFGDKPSFGDRPKRSFGDKPSFGAKPAFGDRPKRAYGDKPSFGDKPKRSYGDKPAGDRPARAYDSDRPKRSFSERPQTGERAATPRPKRDYSERPRPEGGARPEGGGRPPRDFSDKPKRSFGDRPSRPAGDRPSRPAGDRPARPAGDRPGRPPRTDAPGRPPRSDAPGRPPRSNSAPRGDRPDRPARPGGARPPSGQRPTGPRPTGGRPTGGRPPSTRPPGPRPRRPKI